MDTDTKFSIGLTTRKVILSPVETEKRKRDTDDGYSISLNKSKGFKGCPIRYQCESLGGVFLKKP